MPVPAHELKLEIVNAATGQPLGAKAVPGADGTLVVRDYPGDGPEPQLWQFTAAPGAQDDPAYVIRNLVTGKVLDAPAAAGQGVRQSDASGKNGQQWRLVPAEGGAGLYSIEGVADGAVLDLAVPGKDDTGIILGEYDDSAESQRWRLVPAEPERTSDLVLNWDSLSHWNSRQSWRLAHSRTALRPAPDAAPSFSNVLLVLEKFGCDQGAGGWKADGPHRLPAGQAWWAGLGELFLADTTGRGIADIVGLKPAKGAVTSSGRGDGMFEDEERVLHAPASSAAPADLWTLADLRSENRPAVVVLSAEGVRVSARDEGGTFAPVGGGLVLKAFGHGPQAGGWLADKHPRFLADTTGDGRLDIVGCHDDGLWISLQDEEGKFAQLTDEPALKAFGHGPQAGGWLADKHPRFLADTTGDGRLDIVGCHDDGLWVSLQDEEGKFAQLTDEPALKAFGHSEEAGGWLADKHPRFLADTTGDGRLDIVGCHDDGLWVSLQDEEGKFAEPLYVLDEFGVEQGWSSIDDHPRFPVRTTSDGPLDIVGFGPQGVVVARGRGDGTFEPSRLVLNDYGRAQGWTGEKHLRLLADVTGDGNPDIVGFGNEGVWVSHNSGDGRFEQAQLVCRGFGYNAALGGGSANPVRALVGEFARQGARTTF